ncbi:MAG: hypothetical protein N2745_10855 [Syntrophorhabdaceae bacterium]|nr:hypothetical protein [Syntrophorhabdaceae bacterium]
MKCKMMITSLPEAMEMFKEMNILSENEWTGDYRQFAKDAIASFLTSRMNDKVGCHLAQTEAKGIPDRRYGPYLRHLLTELGDVVLWS